MKLLSLYLIVSTALLVQSFNSARTSNFENSANSLQGHKGNAFLQSKDSMTQKKLKAISLNQVKNALDKLLQEMGAPKEEKRDVSKGGSPRAIRRLRHKSKPHRSPSLSNPDWAHWTDWSSCSVTCGKGRKIRWRHCAQNCEGVETEMAEKGCQLPACEGKLFGFIKL